MPLSFIKKPVAAPAPVAMQAAPEHAVAAAKAAVGAAVAKASFAKPQAGGPAPSWMLTGDRVSQMYRDQEAAAELAREEAGKMWRFFLKLNEERRITFLDGALGPDGLLMPGVGLREHVVPYNGKRQNFLCTSLINEPCPLCLAGSRADPIYVFTVIDHTPFTLTKGPNAGKTIEHSRKLFVAKVTALKLLQAVAAKNDGSLVGLTIDVSRIGDDKTPAVGNMFQVVGRTPIADIVTELGAEMATPASYGEEFVMRNAAELTAMGVGKALSGPGNEPGSAPTAQSVAQHL